MKILVFDDDKDFIEMMKDQNGINLQFYTSNRFDEIEDLLKANKFDKILVDYRMPNYEGLKLISKYKYYRNFYIISCNDIEEIKKVISKMDYHESVKGYFDKVDLMEDLEKNLIFGV